MQSQLFMKLEDKSLLFIHYMYFDTDPRMGDRVFEQAGINVVVEKTFASDDQPYKAILCHVKKKDGPKFEAAVKELVRVMLLTGHSDYETWAIDFMSKIRNA